MQDWMDGGVRLGREDGQGGMIGEWGEENRREQGWMNGGVG